MEPFVSNFNQKLHTPSEFVVRASPFSSVSHHNLPQVYLAASASLLLVVPCNSFVLVGTQPSRSHLWKNAHVVWRKTHFWYMPVAVDELGAVRSAEITITSTTDLNKAGRFCWISGSMHDRKTNAGSVLEEKENPQPSKQEISPWKNDPVDACF